MSAVARIPSPVDVVRMHVVKRRAVFVTPLLIVAAVFVVTTIISLALQRLGTPMEDAAAADGARNNPAVAWALSGFVVSLGVMAVSTAFPFSLALGTTRRSFTVGTLLSNAVIAAYFTAIFVALLGLELLTGHWFAGIHLVDVYALGAGDVRYLVPIVFLGTLALMSIGSVFGAAWIRFAAPGAATLGVALGVGLALALLLAAPVLPDIAAAFRVWWLAVAAVAVIALASAGTLLFLRGASVR
ncbi:hypothetical protein [Naasia sp. SYSU D00057]|uniref:hypothetical protein n=1 Tax=Naasia sp. SYSU D00057 TaxID=2817380 RepID=UPI001FEEC33C|nr:hypothetical protein [Naasia sp. SYSU D00057]